MTQIKEVTGNHSSRQKLINYLFNEMTRVWCRLPKANFPFQVSVCQQILNLNPLQLESEDLWTRQHSALVEFPPCSHVLLVLPQ